MQIDRPYWRRRVDEAWKKAFRAEHPRGRNLLVVPGKSTRERKFGDLVVTITSVEALPTLLD